MESSAASPAALNLLPWLLQGAAATCHFCGTAFSLAPHPVLTKPKQAVGLPRFCSTNPFFFFFCLFFRVRRSQGESTGVLCDHPRGAADTGGTTRTGVGPQPPTSAADSNGSLAVSTRPCPVSFAQGQLYIPGPELNALYRLEFQSIHSMFPLYRAQPGTCSDALTWLSCSASRAFLSLIRQSY